MKLYIQTWGCQMNVLDSHVLEGHFAAAGYRVTDREEEADVILLNTCSVREHAENKVFSRIGGLKKLKERRGDVTIVVAGCIAQRLGAELIHRWGHIDLVAGTRRIGELVRLVELARLGGPLVRTEWECGQAVERDVAYRCGRSRAYVCAMRGCDNFCAYCVVPHVRGRQVSRGTGEIVEEVARLADDGVREITLLGQNVTAYGRDRGEKRALSRLLEALHDVRGIEWIKFITCHPLDTAEDVFEAIRDLPKVCRYLHMPAQSGSDRVLAAMKRGYTAAEYRRKIGRLRETAGEVSVAGDFIVGFPGEREEDFDQTVRLLRDVRYKNSFIFKYSVRPGTAAARLADDVPADQKALRNNRLLAVQKEVSLAHNRAFVGRKVAVLVTGAGRKNAAQLAGRAEGEEIVVFEGPPELEGRFVTVEITDASPIVLFGVLAGGHGGGEG